MKVVINRCFGGFGLSQEALQEIRKTNPELVDEHPESSWLGALFLKSSYDDEIRSNPAIVSVVERLGEKANDRYAKLAVVEVPDDVSWSIHDYDGMEHVQENHRTWE